MRYWDMSVPCFGEQAKALWLQSHVLVLTGVFLNMGF